MAHVLLQQSHRGLRSYCNAGVAAVGARGYSGKEIALAGITDAMRSRASHKIFKNIYVQ